MDTIYHLKDLENLEWKMVHVDDGQSKLYLQDYSNYSL